MDEISNKALLIAVGVFVTIIITSGVLFALNQMREVYSQVYETNISLQDMFSEYDEYDNTQKTGIDILNAAKKYKDDNLVTIKVNNVIIDKQSFVNNNNTEEKHVTLGNTIYNTTVEVNPDTGSVVISFK